MQARNHSLGITIPTYRRPEWLRVAVGSMVVAARPFDVPIFVVDDSADDTNTVVVAELQQTYPHILHVRNERNLGIDRNIVKSVNVCDCAFAWPLGEDDLLRADAIERVLPRLVAPDPPPPFLAVNYTLFDEEYHAVLRERFIPLRSDCILPSDEFLRRWSWAIGFIGACVINKRSWSRVDPSRYLDTYWAHAGVILEAIQGEQVTMLADPLVLKRIGSPRVFSWADSTFQVVDGWAELVARLVPVYGEEACREATHAFERVFGLHGRFLIYARGEGLYDGGGFRTRILGKGRGPGYVAGAWLIAHMPRGLARWMVKTSRWARSLRNRIRGNVRPPDLGMRIP